MLDLGLAALLSGLLLLIAWVAVWGLRRQYRQASVLALLYRRSRAICGKTVHLNKNVERRTPTPRSRPDATRASRCESVTGVP